jgi:hypothetical protein
MARRVTKVAPARKAAPRDDDSLLIRSAESLGRVIGSLQRQVQGATKRMSRVADDVTDALPEMPQVRKRAAAGSRKRAATGKPAGARKTRAEKAAGARKSSRGRKT